MNETYSFVIEGKPKPKERPRLTKRGRAYTPKATLEAEKRVRDAYAGPLFTGPVDMEIMLSAESTRVSISNRGWTSPLRGDIDNYIKVVLDGLQGVAFDNDRQVVAIYAEKL